MKLGNFEINVIDTGIFRLDGGAMFGVVPKPLWSKKYDGGDELNRIPLSARPLLIEYGNKKILVDSGNGNKRDSKFNNIYGINPEKNSLTSGLNKLGVTPEQITDVILTHLHFDHVGGCTFLENDKHVPLFQNATHYVQKKHLEWALNPSDKDKASFIRNDFEVLLSEGLLKFTNGEQEIFDNITVIPVSGHTESLQMVYVNGGDENLLYISDLSPTAAHLSYTFGLAYDNFPLLTVEEKKEILPKYYDMNTIICFEHDAFVQSGKLQATEKGFLLGEKITITEW